MYTAVNLKPKQLTIKDGARGIVLLNLTTDRHEASRSLSALVADMAIHCGRYGLWLIRYRHTQTLSTERTPELDEHCTRLFILVAVPSTSLLPADSRVRANHNYKYKNISTYSSQHKNSFFPCTIPQWYGMDKSITAVNTVSLTITID